MTALQLEWNALAARISSLRRAAELFYHSIEKHTQDSRGASTRVLLPETATLFALVAAFRKSHDANLAPGAAACLDHFLESFRPDFMPSEKAATLDHRLPIIQIRTTALEALCGQMEYEFSGLQDRIRSVTERAFLHLQRCLVVDRDLRTRWMSAYDTGEVSCEALGAVHLLWHGIWAFKADTSGARTDLVLGNRIDSPEQVGRVATGLVHTEWKRARPDNNSPTLFREALAQARLYSASALGGVELANVRYCVVVSRAQVSPPADLQEGPVTYRHVNIAIDPDVPSRAARQSAAELRPPGEED